MKDSTLLIEKDGTKVLEDPFGRTYLSVSKNEGVVMLAKLDEHFIFIQQYRKPVDSKIVELPGGGVEKEESIEGVYNLQLSKLTYMQGDKEREQKETTVF